MPLASSLERMNASIGLLTQLVFVTSGGVTGVTGMKGQRLANCGSASSAWPGAVKKRIAASMANRRMNRFNLGKN